MIIKQRNGTVLEMTPEEFAELGGVFSIDADAEGNSEVTTEFKVGDNVEVVGKSIFYNDKYIEKKGVITFVFSVSNIRVDIIGTGERFFPLSSLKLIEEEPEEVLSESNVKEGEYFVITDNSSCHGFTIGEIVKAVSYYPSVAFTASNTDYTEHWNVRYTDVRRATDAEIAEATKSKEVNFEIGDAISVDGRFALIRSELDSEHEYKIKWYSDGSQTYAGKSYIRHATDEEKSHLQTLIGREKDEYKVGDLVELLDGSCSGYRGCEGYIFEVNSVSHSYYHLKDNGNKINDMNTYYEASKLKLITPVEWRHDFI